MRGGSFVPVLWRDIRVGDLVKVRRNESVPADCVFLSSYSQDADTPDTCYVQTAQLDGETSLKLRQAHPATVERFKTDADCAAFGGYIVCEAPNATFDRFIGTMSLRPPPTAVDHVVGGRSRRTIPAQHGEGASARGAMELPPAAAGAGVSGGGEVPASVASVGVAGDDRPVPLEADQTLLRGSVLRNVDYAYAMVVYTGRETKVRVRQATAVSKKAQVETEINRFIVVLVTGVLIVCLAGTISSARWHRFHESRNPHFPVEALTVLDGVRQLFTYFLLNAGFIPVSLYVTVRLARTFQMLFMERDGAMFHCEPDLVRATNGLDGEYPFKVRCMDLNDELGQITHIFSDKTGTLTLNYMELRKVLVRGVAYGTGTTQIGVDRQRREGRDVRAALAQLEEEKVLGRPPGCPPHVNFRDGSESHPGRTLAADQANPRDGGQGTAIHQFLLHLALNHTVLPEIVRDNQGAIVGSRLSASSPDEEAFLMATDMLGYKFTARTHDAVTLAVKWPASHLPLAPLGLHAPLTPVAAAGGGAKGGGGGVRSPGRAGDGSGGCLVTFRVLHILAYSQERKRMSVIVEHPCIDPVTGDTVSGAGGDIYLYCKGADSVIFPRLAEVAHDDGATAAERKFTKRQLADWGSDGLRTLVFAYKRLDRDAFLSWSTAFTAACSDMATIRLRKSKQPNGIDDLMNEMETDLHLQGATANEDKLQPEVPETIAMLGQAGIRTWMVTGDKQVGGSSESRHSVALVWRAEPWL